MRINKDLLPIKVHYFLRYAGGNTASERSPSTTLYHLQHMEKGDSPSRGAPLGTAPLTMLLPLMVRQKGLSARVVGVLWTVLPMVGLITNSISGTLADYLKAHRTVFLGSITCLTMGIAFIYWIPAISLAQGTVLNLTALVEPSSAQGTVLNLTALVEPSSAQGTVLNFTALVEPSSALNLTALNDIPRVPSGLEAQPSGDTSLAVLIYYPVFWLIFFSLMIEQMGISTCVTISDAVCFQILGSERHKYGQQRVWGTIGMGVMAIISGAVVDLYSRGLLQKDYLPAVILGLMLMAMDLVVVARLRTPSTKGQQMRLGAVGSVLAHPQVLLFLITVYVMGTSLGLLWVFKLMLIEDVALAWDPHFQALKLLQGLDMGIENFGGEVPFFFLSGMIIQRVGHTAVLAISLATTALRHCLYSAITNPWWFLPIELLNGPSYSLFHTAMASYASRIAPPGAQATLQSIVRSCFCAGQSTAGFLGGTFFHSIGGSYTFLAVGVFDFAYGIIFGFLNFLIWKYCSREKMLDSGYVPPSSSSSSGQGSSKVDQLSEPVKEPLVEDV